MANCQPPICSIETSDERNIRGWLLGASPTEGGARQILLQDEDLATVVESKFGGGCSCKIIFKIEWEPSTETPEATLPWSLNSCHIAQTPADRPRKLEQPQGVRSHSNQEKNSMRKTRPNANFEPLQQTRGDGEDWSSEQPGAILT
ncbi:unnamed protein product [Cuscuta campestris]|uniref:Uncharacterized protein n=1 Tax=Cuscuta campestris TaxID=132261 RepID=A0A484KES3_9ASTE|nr:unnamed protein product [Cuscuta campestris]